MNIGRQNRCIYALLMITVMKQFHWHNASYSKTVRIQILQRGSTMQNMREARQRATSCVQNFWDFITRHTEKHLIQHVAYITWLMHSGTVTETFLPFAASGRLPLQTANVTPELDIILFNFVTALKATYRLVHHQLGCQPLPRSDPVHYNTHIMTSKITHAARHIMNPRSGKPLANCRNTA